MVHCRIAARRRTDLGAGSGRKIDIEDVGQPHEIDQHICQLLADPSLQRFRGHAWYSFVGW